MSEKTSFKVNFFPSFCHSSIATTLLPSHLAPCFMSTHPSGFPLVPLD